MCQKYKYIGLNIIQFTHRCYAVRSVFYVYLDEIICRFLFIYHWNGAMLDVCCNIWPVNVCVVRMAFERYSTHDHFQCRMNRQRWISAIRLKLNVQINYARSYFFAFNFTVKVSSTMFCGWPQMPFEKHFIAKLIPKIDSPYPKSDNPPLASRYRAFCGVFFSMWPCGPILQTSSTSRNRVAGE